MKVKFYVLLFVHRTLNHDCAEFRGLYSSKDAAAQQVWCAASDARWKPREVEIPGVAEGNIKPESCWTLEQEDGYFLLFLY